MLNAKPLPHPGAASSHRASVVSRSYLLSLVLAHIPEGRGESEDRSTSEPKAVHYRSRYSDLMISLSVLVES